MLTHRFLTTALCTSLLALSACDKEESLGEVESETAAESETNGSSATTGETTGSETEGGTGWICTDDAMLCPDGSAVGRSGPDCEFDPCPGETGSETAGDPPPPACVPTDAYFQPASCPSEKGSTYPIDAECFTPCDLEAPECGEGNICMPVQVDPCPCDDNAELCCDACAGGATLCVPVLDGEVCDAIVGQDFTSVEQYECGISKNGPVLCNWTVDFSANGDYLWMYSDLGEGGTYACKDGVIHLANNSVLEVSYDAESGILTWDGIEYTAAE